MAATGTLLLLFGFAPLLGSVLGSWDNILELGVET